MPIPVFKPSIKRRDMQSVLSCLASDVAGPGMAASQLAKTMSDAFGFAGGVALREHSRAIELAFVAVGLQEGDSLLLSPLGPMAHAIGLRSVRLNPVFADVNTNDACLDADCVNRIMSTEVKAVLVHAPLGMVPDMEVFYSLRLPVIVDAGEALGAREEFGLLGCKADFLVIPMEADGIATAGGGTIILARTKSAFSSLKSLSEDLSPDVFMSDINASLGLVQWREYDKALQERRAIESIYREAIARGRHCLLTNERLGIPYSFPVLLAVGAKEVRHYALKYGVETALAFAGRLLDIFPDAGKSCPNSGLLSIKTMLFPLYPTLGKKNVQLVTKVLSTLP